MNRCAAAVVGAAVLLTLTACAGTDPVTSSRPTPTTLTPSVGTPSPLPSRSPSASATRSPRTSPPSTTAASCAVPARLSLRRARGTAWAFAPLDDPTAVRVEGRTGDDRAWSTSKVLVVAAYLDTVVDGDPRRLDDGTRRLVTAALARSDADAVTAVRDAIPGRPGRAMTAVLRAIGDESTVAPDSYQGLMAWSLREQVRFVAALQQGEVVSERASAYLLRSMRPADDLAWGLGRVGATAYKGGWLRADTLTRQLGLLDGYAVAFATGEGPAVRQSDGDAAHVMAVDALAERLQERIALDRRCR